MEQPEAFPVDRAPGARMQVLLGPEDGTPNFVTRRFTLDPGTRIPRHQHDSIEHEQVMLAGRMTLGLDADEVEVAAGDCMLIPAGVAHWYENRGAEPAVFLCVVPRTSDYATEWLEE